MIPWRGPTSRFSMTPVDASAIPMIRIDSPREARDLDFPTDMEEDSDEVEYTSDWDEMFDMGESSSGSSSDGPETPVEDGPIMLRIKRKSMDVDPVGKRPKVCFLSIRVNEASSLVSAVRPGLVPSPSDDPYPVFFRTCLRRHLHPRLLRTSRYDWSSAARLQTTFVD